MQENSSDDVEENEQLNKNEHIEVVVSKDHDSQLSQDSGFGTQSMQGTQGTIFFIYFSDADHIPISLPVIGAVNTTPTLSVRSFQLISVLVSPKGIRFHYTTFVCK